MFLKKSFSLLTKEVKKTKPLTTTKFCNYSSFRDPFRHIDTKDNNEETIFDFSKEMYPKVHTVLAKYPKNRKRSGILPLLDLAQRQLGGWVSLAAMNKIAQICEVAPIEVYEVATFYVMYNRSPVGKYHVQVCLTTPCMLRGSDEIIEVIENHLGIGLNETTKDGLFTLGEMECMGCCVNAPMMVVSDYSNPPEYSYDFYEDLTIDKTIEILEAFKRGEKPPKGPQNGRNTCMGIQGKTTLFKEPAGPFCRDLNEEPKKQQ